MSLRDLIHPHLCNCPRNEPSPLKCRGPKRASNFQGKGAVVVTEKLDGGNCMICNGKVYARSHGQEAKHESFSRVKALAVSLSQYSVDHCF